MNDEQWIRFRALVKEWDAAQTNEQRIAIFNEAKQIVIDAWQPIQAWMDENGLAFPERQASDE